MKPRTEIQQGRLACMSLKTLSVLGPLPGHGVARRIEQISPDQLALNRRTVYRLFLRLEQQGTIVSEWEPSENNRRALYRRKRVGRKRLQAKLEGWLQAGRITARFRVINAETRSCSL